MKVLIVDDSKVMRRIVRSTLRKAGFDGFDVVEAENGEQGLAMFNEHRPDLVLCDWNMPVMNGIDFLTAVRSTNNKTPFGFVTSEGTDAMRSTALQAGASFYLAKPFTEQDVALTLGQYFK